jgi:type IV secretory pathway VirB4 component
MGARGANRPGHRLSTAHLQSAYPFIAEGALGGRGCYIGRDQYGASFCYDPFELYAQGLITSPNAVVVGEIGSAKSSLAKTLLYREVGVFGRRGWVIDPKGEYSGLCELLGTQPVRLRPGGEVRLNPLSGRASPESRLQVLLAVCAAALSRSLCPEEEAGLREALSQAAQGSPEPTLPAVVAALHEPSRAAAERLHASPQGLAEACREAALSLDALCSGALAGMFDGPTSAGVDLSGRLVVLDLSAMYGQQALGILMACATAALRANIDAEAGAPRRQTILVVDEGWRVFSHLGIGEWLQSTWKLSRAFGLSGWAIMHRVSDLAAAGDQGSREAKLAEGLLADAQTRVVYRQSADELGRSKDLLGLSSTEAEIVSDLQPGQAIWKVGARSFLVQHRLSATEAALVDTDARMGERRGGAGR